MKFARKSILAVLYGTIVVLSILHIINLILYFSIGDPDKFDFIQLIDFDYEANIPTVFSSLLFFINAVLLYLLFKATRINLGRGAKHWLGLCMIFLFLGFDESATIHEQIGDLVETLIIAEGYLYFPWVIPYGAAFLILVAIYFPFYLRLDRRTKVLFFVAAFLFVMGAAGLDIISGEEAYIHGTETILYSALYTVEEILEMTGLVVLIGSLMELLEQQKVSASLS